MSKIRVRAIIEKNGKYLLVKSNEEKTYGKWLFAGGNAESDDYIKEVQREIKEELGAELINPRFAFVVKGKHGLTHFYIGNLKGKIKTQKEEIADYKWLDLNSAKELELANSTKLAFEKLK